MMNTYAHRILSTPEFPEAWQAAIYKSLKAFNNRFNITIVDDHSLTIEWPAQVKTDGADLMKFARGLNDEDVSLYMTGKTWKFGRN